MNPPIFILANSDTDVRTAGYPGKIVTIHPRHIQQPIGDNFCAVYALWSLSGGNMMLKTYMDSKAADMFQEAKEVANIPAALREVQPLNGFYNQDVLKVALRDLGLSFVPLPNNEQLKSRVDVDITPCCNQVGFRGFLVITPGHFFAYVKTTKDNGSTAIYNCDSRLDRSTPIPNFHQLRHELICHRCNKSDVWAIFDTL